MSQQNSSISNFKQFLLRVFCPVILLLAIAGGISTYFFERYIILGNETSGAHKVNKILTQTHPEEVPIFGSSRAEGGYIPSILGKNYFNYGLAGAQENVTLFFLKEECNKKKTNPTIIVHMDLEGINRGLGDVSNYLYNIQNAQVKSLVGSAYKPYFSIPFIKYYGRFESCFRSFVTSLSDITKYTDHGAVIEKNSRSSQAFNALVAERRKKKETFTIDSTTNVALFDLIQKNPARKFVFVLPPYHSSYFESYQGAKAASAFFKELGSKPNARIIDFSRAQYPDSFFFDTSHLSYAGAVYFSKSLRDSLEAEK